MSTSEALKRAQKKYYASPKGKAMVKAYTKTEAFKRAQKKYRSSDKSKQHKKDHPEIYKVGLRKMLDNNVCGILIEHAEKVGDDPERLTTEDICKLAGIELEEKK